MEATGELNLACHFKDHRERYFCNMWASLKASLEQRDEIGLAYISMILALGEESARRFSEGDVGAYHQVGLRQGCVIDYRPDLGGYWHRVNNIFPGLHNGEDIEFLVEGKEAAVRVFQWQIAPMGRGSLVLRRLWVNAHAYK